MAPRDGDKFSKALDRLIDYFAEKYDITFAEVIGVMHMKIMDLHSMAPKEEEEEDV